MLKRFLGFLVGASLLVGFGALFYLNPGTVEFHLTGERSYVLPLPLLLALAFLAGAALIFLLALFRETQWTLSDVLRRRREGRHLERDRVLEAGRRLAWKGDPEGARSTLKRFSRRPDDLEALLALAEATLESGRTDEAVRLLGDASVRHPQSSRILELFSRAQERSGGDATKTLERAVALEPASPRLLARLRDRYAAEARWPEALQIEERLLPHLRDPKQAIREQRRIRGLRYQQAVATESEGDANRLLRALLSESPHFLPAVLALGDRLTTEGEPREAEKVWLRAVNLRPEPVLLARMEAFYRDAGRPERMLGLYKRLRRRSDSPTLRLRHARFLISIDRIDEAESALDGGILAHEREYHALMGELQRRRGNTAEAVAAFQRALDHELQLATPVRCRECAFTNPGWVARCPRCGAWDSLENRI